MTSPRIIILTGTSCAGKSTVAKQIVERGNVDAVKFITTTTRPMRSHEENGKQYWFVSKDEFKELIAKDGLYEWAEVYGEYYGSSKAEMERLQKGDKHILMVIDIQGAAQIKSMDPSVITICIHAPEEDLQARLDERGDDVNNLEERKKQIQKEQEYCKEADFSVENPQGELEKTLKTVENIILSGA